MSMDPSFAVTEAGIGGLGPWELGIILVIILIIFGAGRLPKIGRSVGEAIRNFKKGMKNEEEKKGKDDASGPTP